MRGDRWHTNPVPYEKIRTLADAIDSSDILATVLVRRGYGDAESASAFLESDGPLHDPFIFPDMAAACQRLRSAIDGGERIVVHGDYDVDGITSAALLVNVIRHLGGTVGHHLPNRFTEGYGIAMDTVERLAADGNGLLITVDCGIAAREQLSRAAELGMDSIVIDHHQPVEGLLPTAAVISPLLSDYPFKQLAGVGLAFKVAQALLSEDSENRLPTILQEQLDLVALGTIADVVPLLDENRCLVKRGLPQLARTRRPGLLALMKRCQVEPSRINTGLVAFRLAPRLNAAGRLEDPGTALNLLLAEDEHEAGKLAEHLESLNRERQRIENQILAEAQEQVGALPEELREAHGYVLSSPGWHEGVIGIVASKMVELHHRPVIMIAEGSEHGKGSGRSIGAFDLHAALVELSPHLEAFGGHRAACGLTVAVDRVTEFRQAFAEYADRHLEEADLHPSRYIDALVSGRELTLDLAEELSRLEPFGLGNPSVDLLAAGARLTGCRSTRDGRHLQCQVETGGARASAIGFGQGHLTEKIKTSPKWDVIFRLEENEFNGSVSPQLKLRDFYPHVHEQLPQDTCNDRCSIDCPDRISGEEFWSLATGNGGAMELELYGETDTGLDDPRIKNRLVDRRGRGGIHGLVTMLASCGESILLLTADVARRRNLVMEELTLARRGAGRVVMASGRCSRAYLESLDTRGSGSNAGIALADFATAAGLPGLAGSYRHIVFIDPPLNRSLFNRIAAAAPASFIHLFYCADEVQFTEAVLEHEYQLRAPLKKVYRHLKAGDRNPLDGTTERLLLSGGKYIRQPGLVARCMRVLEELELIRIEGEVADRVIVVPETAAGAELEDSASYRRSVSFYKECATFLSKSLNEKMI